VSIDTILPQNIAGFTMLHSVHETNPDYVRQLLSGDYDMLVFDALFAPLGPYLSQRMHIPYALFHVTQVNPETAYHRSFAQAVSATLPLYEYGEW
jgi:hypothetical protein